jgi:uncharacterized protein YciU (UPF0263 family)
MTSARDKQLLEEVKRGLEPPDEDELKQVIAKMLFGENTEKMPEHAPWSFRITKLMWVKGEEPWES